MIKNTIFFSLFLLFIQLTGEAQTTDYWVFYYDKPQTENIDGQFDNKAIERRNREGISFEISDFPVDKQYETRVAGIATDFLGSTKWFNASYVKATEEQIAQIMDFPFVKEVKEAMVWDQDPVCSERDTGNASDLDILRSQQTGMFHPEYFDEKDLSGKGVRIAILDAGFPFVEKHMAFEHLRNNNQIIDTYDFIKDERYAFRGNAHGTMVLSCIAGMYYDKRMGLAPDAEFLLARTEKIFEPFREEIYWLRAMEWADENGADLINSSLGYTYHRYFQSDMDGKTSLITRAANMAAEKGILVVNAAGNEGEDGWHVIGTPADADSILSIGGVDPKTNLHISFSSYGPTADGRLKPNLSASGKALVADKRGGYTTAFGTSFASPLTCGFAACARQAFPGLTAMELKTKLESSGSLYPYFDYAHGYGIPDAAKLFGEKRGKESVELDITDETVKINLSEEYLKTMNIHNQNILFYHILNKDNTIDEYKVIQAYRKNVCNITLEQLKGKKLQVYFNGYTTTKQF